MPVLSSNCQAECKHPSHVLFHSVCVPCQRDITTFLNCCRSTRVRPNHGGTKRPIAEVGHAQHTLRWNAQIEQHTARNKTVMKTPAQGALLLHAGASIMDSCMHTSTFCDSQRKAWQLGRGTGLCEAKKFAESRIIRIKLAEDTVTGSGRLRTRLQHPSSKEYTLNHIKYPTTYTLGHRSLWEHLMLHSLTMTLS